MFFGGFVLLGGRGLVTLLLFLYVTEEVGRKYVQDICHGRQRPNAI